MSVLATDNFNRANESPLASPWLHVGLSSGNANLASNAIVSANLTLDFAYNLSGVTWPPDQYSQAKISVTGTNADTGYGVGLRGTPQGGTHDYYRIVVSKAASNNVLIDKFVNGVNTLITRRTTTWVDGDVLRAEITGSTIKVFQNGVQLGADISDSSIATGNAVICYSSTSTAGNIDDWEGGDLAAIDVPRISPVSLQILVARGII